MNYNFDSLMSRKHTDCIKWDGHMDFGMPEDTLPMWVADMDFELPSPIAKAIATRASHPIFGYTLLTPKYKDAICHWMSTRHNWEIASDWLVVVPNVVGAINIAIKAFTSPGEKVLIQEPVYNPFSRSILTNERQVAVNELVCIEDRFEIDFEDFEAKVSDPAVKLFILCNPHNPVGRVWTPLELQKMGELCLAHDVVILSDEIHQDIVFKAYKHTPIGTLSTAIADNLITCTSTGKTFNSASISLGNIIIPNEKLREQFVRAFSQIGIDTMSPFAQQVVEVGYTECEDWVDALVEYIEGNKCYVEEFVSEHLPMIRVTKSEATYLLWIDMRGLGLTPEALLEFMTHEAKIWINPGTLFGKCGEGYVRMNIATCRENVVRAMKNLRMAVSK
ncbi:MAG: MalY/PatB family protein [Cellulosilyticaceae bacterium]